MSARALTIGLTAFLWLSFAEEAAAKPPKIVQRPIKFGKERQRLTVAYRQFHQPGSPANHLIEPKMIVVHHTASSSAERTFRYFDRVKMSSRRAKLKKEGLVNVSTHFLVDRKGTIYQLMPLNYMARHVIGLNHLSIGIENVGDGKKYPLTSAQLKANVELIKELKRRYSAITHLIGHHEYRRMEGHEYFWEKDPKYRTSKVDPGPDFMRQLRKGLQGLGLQGPPPR